MRTARLFLALSVWGLACVPVDRAVPGLPEEAEWLVVLAHDAEGRFVEASGLMPVDALPLRLGRASADTDLDLLAYRGDQIGGPDPTSSEVVSTLAATPIEPVTESAATCVTRLPRPIWSGRARDDSFLEPSPLASLDLLAPGLSQVCPDLSGSSTRELLLDSDCAPQRCAHVTQDGCTIRIGESDCGVSGLNLTVKVLATGELCVPEGGSTAVSCEAAELRSESVGTLECALAENECDLWLVAPEAALEGIDIVRARTHPESDRVIPDEALQPVHYLNSRLIRRGLLFDLLVLEDRVVVAGRDVGGDEVHYGCQRNTLPDDGVLFSFDLETAELMDRRPTPPCLLRMAEHSTPGQFYGAFVGDDMKYRVGVFDASGELLQQSPAGLFSTRTSTSTWVAGLEWLEQAQALVVLFGYEVEPFFEIDVVNADLSEVTQTIASETGTDRGAPVSMTSIAGRFVALNQMFGDSIYVFRPGAQQFTTSIRRDRGDTQALHISYDPRGPRVITAFGGEYGRVFDVGISPSDGVLEIPKTIGAALYEAYGQVTASHPLVFGDDQLLSVLLPDEDWTSALARYDPNERYVRPGLLKLLDGPVTEMEADTSGRIWMISPWSGELARVELQKNR